MSRLMVDAIELVLRQRDFRAGDRRIGYRSCSYTAGESLDALLCERNAREHAAARDVLGVIGPLHSRCAQIQLPILALRTAGPVAMISPSNTYVGLTRAGPGADTAHPSSLYPDGLRNYVRVLPPDGAQGAALARYARSSRMRRVVTLFDHEDPYAVTVSESFLETARSSGMSATSLDWPEQPSYTALARRIARGSPDLVYVTGPRVGQQAYVKRLVHDLRSALGPRVVIAGTDNFLFPGALDELGPVGEGLLATTIGIPSVKLPRAGRTFLAALGKERSTDTGFVGAPEAAQAAEVLLDAIARSDGSRASVVAELFRTEVKNAILGSFRFDRNGDISPATATVYRIEHGRAVLERLVRVPSAEGS